MQTVVPPVTGLVANPISPTEIDLTYNQVANASYYIIYRNGIQVGTDTSPPFQDINLAPGTTYSYTMSVVTSNGQSAQCPAVTASTVTIGVIPGQVQGLTATAVSPSQINLIWTPTANAASYNVYQQIFSVVPALAAAAGFNTQTFKSTIIGNTSGTWQASNLSGVDPGTGTQNGDGSLTLTKGVGLSDGNLVTAIKNSAFSNNWSGIAFTPGMYIKVVFSWTGTNGGASGGNGYPALWALPVSHGAAYVTPTGGPSDPWPGQSLNYEHWLEVDFYEAYVAGQNTGKTTMIDWSGLFSSGQPNNGYNTLQSENRWTLPGVQTFSTPHTLEVVWINATASTQGSFQTYIDGINIQTINEQWTPPPSPPVWNNYNGTLPPPVTLGTSAFSIGDTQQFSLIIGTGAVNPQTVYSYEVWQASAAGATIQ